MSHSTARNNSHYIEHIIFTGLGCKCPGQRNHQIKKRVKKDGRTPKKLWHDLLTEFTGEFGGKTFFGGDSPNLVDLAAFGYVRSISPYPQFSQIEEHQNGMEWYRAVEATLKV